MSMNQSDKFHWSSPYKAVRHHRVRLVGVLVFVGVCLTSVFCVRSLQNSSAVFSKLTSPHNTYTVSLKGSKGRAFVRSNEVRVDVLKLGQPYASDIWLHSASNPFDLSFDAGFPDFRWRGDNVLEFYRQQYFDKGSDSLRVWNASSKAVKYMRVQSVNKFILLDFESMASLFMEIPAPRGDFQWIAVEGAFSDGQVIPFNHKSFDRRSKKDKHAEYQIQITSTGALIESVER